MKVISLFFSILISFIFKFGLAQTTVILQPNAEEGKDASVHSLDTYTSGSTIAFEAMAWTYDGTPGIERCLIDFDFSQIPEGSEIVSANLSLFDPEHLYDHHSNLSGSNVSILQRITSSWEENGVTWDNQPSTTEENQVFLDEITTEYYDYLDLDISALVQDIVDDPSSSFGLLFKLQTEEYYRSVVFASSDHEDSNKHPKLEITFIPSSTCITLQPGPEEGKDARVHSLDTYTSGSTIEFEAMAWTYDGTAGIERCMIDFDFSQIPSGSEIVSADLSLYDPEHPYDHHSNLSGSNVSILQRITSSWEEDGVTWDNQPSTTEENQVFLDEITTEYYDYIDLDISNLIQDIVNNPNSSFGLLFKLQTEEQFRSVVFASSDHDDSNKHPKLNICYNEPSTIFENDNQITVSIYPNPTTELITIETKSQNISKIQIFDINGKEVMHRTVNSNHNEINVSHLPQSIYLIKIEIGDTVISKKFLKYKQ